MSSGKANVKKAKAQGLQIEITSPKGHGRYGGRLCTQTEHSVPFMLGGPWFSWMESPLGHEFPCALLTSGCAGIKSSSVCVRNVAFEATRTSTQCAKVTAVLRSLNRYYSFQVSVSSFATDSPGKELYQLFGAYGTVVSCRLPKKADYSGHRGWKERSWSLLKVQPCQGYIVGRFSNVLHVLLLRFLWASSKSN